MLLDIFFETENHQGHDNFAKVKIGSSFYFQNFSIFWNNEAIVII